MLGKWYLWKKIDHMYKLNTQAFRAMTDTATPTRFTETVVFAAKEFLSKGQREPINSDGTASNPCSPECLDFLKGIGVLETVDPGRIS